MFCLSHHSSTDTDWASLNKIKHITLYWHKIQKIIKNSSRNSRNYLILFLIRRKECQKEHLILTRRSIEQLDDGQWAYSPSWARSLCCTWFLSWAFSLESNDSRGRVCTIPTDFLYTHINWSYEWVIQILVKAKLQSRKLSIINPPWLARSALPLLAALAGPAGVRCQCVRQSVTGLRPGPAPSLQSLTGSLTNTKTGENTSHHQVAINCQRF